MRMDDTPYTGAEENSSIGLFIMDGDEKEGRMAAIFVSLNDEKERDRLVNRVDSINSYYGDEEDKNPHLQVGLYWNIGYNLDEKEFEDATEISAAMISIGLAAKKDDETEEEHQVILESAAVLPLKVVEGWLREIYDGKVDSLGVIIIDGEAILSDGSQFLDVRRHKRGIQVATRAGSMLRFFWPVDDSTKQQAKDYLDTQAAKNNNDILYGHIPYKNATMKVITADKEE